MTGPPGGWTEMRVLVVDDDSVVGEVLRDYLHEIGHEPLVACTGEDALSHVRAGDADAIVLDLQLPGMRGLDFLKIVHESGVPVVAVSGVVTEDQARECLELGATDFVAKPVPLERLQQILVGLEPRARTGPLEPEERCHPVSAAEKRREPRAGASWPVRWVLGGCVVVRTRALDTSPHGIRLELPIPLDSPLLQAGERHRIEIELEDGERLARMAEIRHVTGRSAGFCFEEPLPSLFPPIWAQLPEPASC